MTTAKYLGMEGTGLALKDARADAKRKVEAAMDGYYTPKCLNFENFAILLYRDPHGWNSTRIEVAGDVPPAVGTNPIGSVSSGLAACQGAARNARRHAAQLLWRFRGSDGFDALLPDDEAGRQNHASCVNFWNAFSQKREEPLAAGVSVDDAYSQAENWARYPRHGIPPPPIATED